MRPDQIADMNIVADTGAIGRIVIRTENLHRITLAANKLACHLYQMRRRL